MRMNCYIREVINGAEKYNLDSMIKCGAGPLIVDDLSQLEFKTKMEYALKNLSLDLGLKRSGPIMTPTKDLVDRLNDVNSTSWAPCNANSMEIEEMDTDYLRNVVSMLTRSAHRICEYEFKSLEKLLPYGFHLELRREDPLRYMEDKPLYSKMIKELRKRIEQDIIHAREQAIADHKKARVIENQVNVIVNLAQGSDLVKISQALAECIAKLDRPENVF